MSKRRNNKPSKLITNYQYNDIFIQDINAVKQLNIFEASVSNVECYKHDYVFKRIDAGNQRELEVFPGFYASQNFMKKREKQKEVDPRKMKENNTRKKYKKFERLMHNNFVEEDWNITLTFNDEHLPQSKEETLKALRAFILSLSKKRKRKELPPVKYLYVMEQGSQNKRWHIHIVMDTLLPIEDVIKSWGKRGIARVDPLTYVDNEGKENFVNLCRYLTKHKENYPDCYKDKAWDFIYGSSQNLVAPKERECKTPIAKKAVKKMAVKDRSEQLEAARQVFEKKYKDYEVTDVEVKANPHYEDLYCIHVRMQKRSGSNTKNRRVRN